ncbi:unnamed protein product [Clavelina lepadiformis]|uniref:Bis(5'-nucleosyl)-tetraphosphatase [asymmetrical] n=1 Tax=Clavelina lepadiformis TaxID=159417 RepID=A0ABP0FA03_CLALP
MSALVVKRATGFLIYRQLPCDKIEFLLLQASYKDHHWTPPKGHVDSGEDDITTAYRETKEEAGFDKEDLIVKDFKVEMNYQAYGRPKIVIYFLAELKNPHQNVTLSEEHQDSCWLSLDEACHKVAYEDMQETLQKCYIYIKSS